MALTATVAARFFVAFRCGADRYRALGAGPNLDAASWPAGAGVHSGGEGASAGS